MREIELALLLIIFRAVTAGSSVSLLSPKGVNFEGELHIALCVCVYFIFIYMHFT